MVSIVSVVNVCVTVGHVGEIVVSLVVVRESSPTVPLGVVDDADGTVFGVKLLCGLSVKYGVRVVDIVADVLVVVMSADDVVVVVVFNSIGGNISIGWVVDVVLSFDELSVVVDVVVSVSIEMAVLLEVVASDILVVLLLLLDSVNIVDNVSSVV